MSESQITDLDSQPDTTPKATAKTAAKAKTLKVEGGDVELCGKTKTITIHRQKGETNEAVFVGLNGYGYHIPRGVPCEVPVEVVEILQNAVETVYNEGEAEEVPRHTFSVSN